MRVAQVSRNEHVHRTACQLCLLIAEQLRQPPVDGHDHAVVIGQHHPVAERVDEASQDRRGNRGPVILGLCSLAMAVRRRGPTGMFGRGCRDRGLQGGVDRDQPVQTLDSHHPPDHRRADHEPQRGAADHRAL